MSQYAFHINVDKCISCRACVMACKDKHNLPVGYKYRKVHCMSTGTWTVNDNGTYSPKDVLSYALSLACNHCASPACKAACPAGAIGKRQDGVVFIDHALCIGCRSCETVCPYQAPSFDSDTQKMNKCDFCRELLDIGEQPTCVAACNMFAIEYADLGALRSSYPEAVQQIEPLPDPYQTKPSLLVTPPRKYNSMDNNAGNTFSYNLPEELTADKA